MKKMKNLINALMLGIFGIAMCAGCNNIHLKVDIESLTGTVATASEVVESTDKKILKVDETTSSEITETKSPEGQYVVLKMNITLTFQSH